MGEVISHSSEEGNRFIIVDSVGVGFDPLHQRRTLAVKWQDGDKWRGFWLDVTTADPETSLRSLGHYILDLVRHPEKYELVSGWTPAGSELIPPDGEPYICSCGPGAEEGCDECSG